MWIYVYEILSHVGKNVWNAIEIDGWTSKVLNKESNRTNVLGCC